MEETELSSLENHQIQSSNEEEEFQTTKHRFHHLVEMFLEWLSFSDECSFFFLFVCFCSCNLICLFFIGIAILFGASISQTDYHGVTFDYTTNLSQLQPFDSNFTSYNVFLDGHSHTISSDGVMSHRQLIEWGLANGYNAMIVTDHNTVAGGLAARKIAEEEFAGRMLIIPGFEYSNCRIHMNLIGIDQDIPICQNSSPCPHPTDADIQAAINLTHQLGGLVVINHLPFSLTFEGLRDVPRLQNHPSLFSLIQMGIDGIEVANSVVFDWQSISRARNNSLFIITGSDVHIPGRAYAWTLLNINGSLNQASVLNELRNRRNSFIFDALGTSFPNSAIPLQPSHDYQTASPFLGIGIYLTNYFILNRGFWSFQGISCHNLILETFPTASGLFFLYLFLWSFCCCSIFFLLKHFCLKKILIYYRKNKIE